MSLSSKEPRDQIADHFTSALKAGEAAAPPLDYVYVLLKVAKWATNEIERKQAEWREAASAKLAANDAGRFVIGGDDV